MSAAMTSLLRRNESLGIRAVSFDVGRHLQSDPGCRFRSVERLRPHIGDYEYALVVFDKDGCGSSDPRETIQAEVERKLRINGWPDKSKAIVIDPELETWVWNDSPSTAAQLGWSGTYAELKAWLRKKNLWPKNAPKPPDPKEAMEQVLARTRTPRSATLFAKLAKTVGLAKCQDAAFQEMTATLRAWFPQTSA